MTSNGYLLKRVAEIYSWLDSQIRDNTNSVNLCRACGRCCNFDTFDHHLFVTPPETMYLAAKLGSENIKSMTTGWCPYNVGSKCSVYDYRFAGCRIFYCKADVDFQIRLSESTLKRFKLICEDFQIPYRYTDLPTALNSSPG